MSSKRFPFTTFELGAPPIPLVPFNFPKGKNVLCLVDSGASTSFINEKFMHHEEVLCRKGSKTERVEGVCGTKCLEILGETEKIDVIVAGLNPVAKLAFRVISSAHKVDCPIIGVNLLEYFDVSFVREKGELYTVITER